MLEWKIQVKICSEQPLSPYCHCKQNNECSDPQLHRNATAKEYQTLESSGAFGQAKNVWHSAGSCQPWKTKRLENSMNQWHTAVTNNCTAMPLPQIETQRSANADALPLPTGSKGQYQTFASQRYCRGYQRSRSISPSQLLQKPAALSRQLPQDMEDQWYMADCYHIKSSKERS